MIDIKIQLLLLLFLIPSYSFDYCRDYETYQTCINSIEDKCMWDNNRNLCQKTNDYLQGCSLTLNKKACVRQIGNALGQLAKCRFVKVCEVISDFKTEKCLNNLSKSGCLSIQNPEQICFWKNDQCQVLYQNQWNQVQQDFDSVLYSSSACYLIENYLVIHSTLLWDLISYTPDLFAEAEEIFKREIGIIVEDSVQYDNPSTVQMQNNFQFFNGSYAWYTVRESKQIKLTKLKKTYRYRDGCIALEIENDKDFYNIFRLTDEVRGINHIYCKYLNRNPELTKKYIYSNGVCKEFNNSDLYNQNKIIEFGVSCKSIDYHQCIYYISNTNDCRLKGIEYEYPCVNLEKEYEVDCLTNECTVKQCQSIQNYYLDPNTNRCTKSCYSVFYNKQVMCEANKECKYLGYTNIFFVFSCSPVQGCDQPGLQNMYCRQMFDQCGWDQQSQRCYKIKDEDYKYMQCSQAITAKSCIKVKLSDQICYWDYFALKCKNVLDIPILINHSAILDKEFSDIYVFRRVISNENFCKYQQNLATEYFPISGKCSLDQRDFVNNLNNINSYSCVNVQPGYLKWDSYKQRCISFLETEVIQFNCLDQYLVNERICQKSKVSQSNFICIYNQETNSCKEIEKFQFEDYGCNGYGFSRELCINKQKVGAYCQFLAEKCNSLSESYINSIQCSSLQNVNQQVCQLYSSSSQVCVFDESIHSCYTPSIYTKLMYSLNLNRYGCQLVQDSLTYFNLDLNKCSTFNPLDTYILSNLECESNFINQKTCELIIKNGQNCYWDIKLNQCKNYSGFFINCAEIANFTQRVCTSLVTDMTKQLLKDNYCTYIDNICISKSETIVDCGESEYMNLHRCSGLTGISDLGEYIQMCAFLNNKCTTLIENSMDTFIALNNISCSQANLKTCTKVETNGQYCKIIDNVQSNSAIFDKKCIQIDESTKSCSTINSNITNNIINSNYCSKANDQCVYNSDNGCITPISTNLECHTPGLSHLGCILNTQNHRCGFFNKKCRYLPQYQNVSDCKYLNQFSCSQFAFLNCYWNGSLCAASTNNTTQYGGDYTCSLDSSSTFIVSTGVQCQIEQEQSNYELYSCDSKLNQYACESIPNQYCQFIQNKCQFYKTVLCEDSINTCSQNNSLNQKCVLKNGMCFHNPYTYYSCDYFEKTNYEFCLQYPNCIYLDQKCQNINQQSKYLQCYTLTQFKCVTQNKQLACYWSSEGCLEFSEKSCPSLNGFYSFLACNQFNDCQHGYTKSGLGFCYQGNTFQSLTCDQLKKDLCLEDLTHLNSSLFCYWDQSCKNINNNQINQCSQLINFQSSYPACAQLNQELCMYSFIDKKCKLTQEYNSTNCQGTTAKQCSQIENICYFNGSDCVSQGLQNELNKYGCINQQGTWKFTNFKCNQIIDELQNSCNNLSKEACLSDLTQELICQWQNNKCQAVLEIENKQITNCENLNQRACQNVRLSNIQCFWNETLKHCDTLIITNTNCTLDNLVKTSSISVCSGSINVSCVKHQNNTQCTEIKMKVNDCNQYGLNQYGCIQGTNVPCQWIQINDGGYCEIVNIHTALCSDNVNQLGCLNIETPGQACKWNQQTQSCFNEEISTCESASYLNLLSACNAVTTEPCYFDTITNQCVQLKFTPQICSINFNQLACKMSTDNCIWQSNRCITVSFLNCSQYLTKSRCLNSIVMHCQWLNNECIDFKLLENQVYCKDLPLNINYFACASNAIDPCIYDEKAQQCLPDQSVRLELIQWKTIYQLIRLVGPDYFSPILSGKCEQLHKDVLCTKSRIAQISCIWKDSTCQEIKDFDTLNCTDKLNQSGCQNVKKENEFCFWQDQKCLRWNPNISTMENVNKNICMHYSINSIYENNSCIKKPIESISCSSDGISKITCLSIQNQQCHWQNQCVEFIITKQSKCSDFQNVTSYVCQMIQDMACSYDIEKNSCIEVKNDVVGLGVSRQACILNKKIPTYWNGTTCQEIFNQIECDSQLIVNEYTCRIKVNNTSCIYDTKNNTCKSQFNIWSLKCNTQGLNLLGCVQIKQEPCIFKDNQCQLFTELSKNCMFITQVNSKACAAVRDQYCSYDPINFRCQTSSMSQDYCNIQGISKNVCETKNLCKWNQDNLDCKCKTIQEIEVCQQTSITNCRAQSKCYFDQDQQHCIKKQCYHLKEDECNQIIDNKVCYRSRNNGCQPATTCEDLIDPKDACSTIYINQQSCVQAGNFCITATNYKLYCPYSDCSNSNCILYYGTCKMQTCEDLSNEDCQKKAECYLDQENNCQELLRCSQITQNLYGEQVINICNKSSVDGFKCNWQKYELLDDTEICTNKVCEIYGPSQTLCQGNEINGYSCVLFNDLICKQCEQITEQCFCNQQINICTYENGKCKSILCSSFLTKDKCIQATNRCYWSTQLDQNNIKQEFCVKECDKILDADECNGRINECYFENINGLCIKGYKEIPDLSSKVRIEEFYSMILSTLICLNVIIFI